MAKAINRSEASKEQRRHYAKKNPDRMSRNAYRWRLKKYYGLTLEEYEKKLIAQNGLCAICQQPETTVLKKSLIRLAVDHSHKTGKVRDLLCANCNAALGFLNEDILKFQAAIAYLRKHGAD